MPVGDDGRSAADESPVRVFQGRERDLGLGRRHCSLGPSPGHSGSFLAGPVASGSGTRGPTVVPIGDTSLFFMENRESL